MAENVAKTAILGSLQQPPFYPVTYAYTRLSFQSRGEERCGDGWCQSLATIRHYPHTKLFFLGGMPRKSIFCTSITNITMLSLLKTNTGQICGKAAHVLCQVLWQNLRWPNTHRQPFVMTVRPRSIRNLWGELKRIKLKRESSPQKMTPLCLLQLYGML